MKENDERNIWIKKVRAITILKISIEFFYTGKKKRNFFTKEFFSDVIQYLTQYPHSSTSYLR